MADNTEIWKSIEETHYSVSSLGRVKNDTTGKILTPFGCKGSYLGVHLGKKRYARVHRLVAATFVENPNMKPEVNHKDGNKQNNAANNLEWATHSENQKHRFYVLGKKFTNEKMKELTAQAAMVNRKKVYCEETDTVYQSIDEASAKTGISRAGISNCARGMFKQILGTHWHLVDVDKE